MLFLQQLAWGYSEYYMSENLKGGTFFSHEDFIRIQKNITAPHSGHRTLGRADPARWEEGTLQLWPLGPQLPPPNFPSVLCKKTATNQTDPLPVLMSQGESVAECRAVPLLLLLALLTGCSPCARHLRSTLSVLFQPHVTLYSKYFCCPHVINEKTKMQKH